MKGFTLTEIMVTLAIVASISMVAYPSYVKYANRNVVVDGITAADKAKLAVEETYIEKQSLTSASDSFTFKRGFVSWAAGTITITYGTSVNTGCTVNSTTTNLCGQLIIRPTVIDDFLKWECFNGNNPIDSSTLPSNCSKTAPSQ